MEELGIFWEYRGVIGVLCHGVEFVVRDGNLRTPVEGKCYRSSSLRCLGHSIWLRMQSVKGFSIYNKIVLLRHREKLWKCLFKPFNEHLGARPLIQRLKPWCEWVLLGSVDIY